MNILVYNPPIDSEDINQIEEMVAEGDCLFTTFNFLKKEQFKLSTYILNEDIEFIVLQDRNFTSELNKIFNLAVENPKIQLSKEQKLIAAYQVLPSV